MADQGLEALIAECRPYWPTEIESAWAVMGPDEDGGFDVEGPFDTAEAAHRVAIPRKGCVIYNCESAQQAALAAVLS